MWHALSHMDISLLDKVGRTVLVYLGLAVLLRLAGKRDLAQLNTFDLVVMLLLSNVVQNAIIGPDSSLIGGLIGAAVLVGFNALISRWASSSSLMANLFEGHDTVLARDGVWIDKALRREGIRRADAEAVVRRQGANSIRDCALVTLGAGGSFVVQLKTAEQSATHQDVARLEAKLDALLAGQTER